MFHSCICVMNHCIKIIINFFIKRAGLLESFTNLLNNMRVLNIQAAVYAMKQLLTKMRFIPNIVKCIEILTSDNNQRCAACSGLLFVCTQVTGIHEGIAMNLLPGLINFNNFNTLYKYGSF